MFRKERRSFGGLTVNITSVGEIRGLATRAGGRDGMETRVHRSTRIYEDLRGLHIGHCSRLIYATKKLRHVLNNIIPLPHSTSRVGK